MRLVAPPVSVGAPYADALMQKLKRLSAYHRGLELVPRAPGEVVFDDESVVVVSRGTLRLVLPLETVIHVYPHILADMELCTRVAGREIEPAFDVTFCFDAHTRLARVELSVDLCATFISLLGPTSAAVVFGMS